MSRRGARLAVAVLFALAAATAAWEYIRLERAIGEARDAADAFDREARALTVAVVELRASQQAYVAAGQGTEFWAARVRASLSSLNTRIGALRERATVAEAGLRLDSASSTMDSFARMDLRAHEYARTNQRLLASDIIFADGFEMTQSLLAEVDAARQAESETRNDAIGADARRQHLLVGLITGLGLLFLLILAVTPATSAGREMPEPADDSPQEAVPSGSLGLALHQEPDSPPPPVPPEPFPVTAPAASQSISVIDLGETASLCLDLARVSDSHELSELLARAARLLDAPGIMLWMADPEGRELVPTVAHGYPPAVVSRLEAMRSDADNAMAATFREQIVHTVKGTDSANGAVVAPLVASTGCIGVMAAEVRNQREQHEAVRAVAAILAAQLALLVGVTPAQPRQAVAGE